MDTTATGVQSGANAESSDGRPSQNDPLAREPHPKRRSDLSYRTIDGQTVILDREGGWLHQLNPTASFIWDCCDGTSKISEIIDRLVDAYEVDSITARKDVGQVLAQLRSSKLLETY
jgi:Coenzyme PQQ synthesis protein D (PqqD)